MNTEEFKSTFLPLGPLLYRIAFRMLGSGEDARDAVQELYVRLCRKGDRALRSGNPQGYCVRMMQNICADILRRDGHNVLRMAADVTEVREGPAVEAVDSSVEGREEAVLADGDVRDRGTDRYESGQYPGHTVQRQKDVEGKNSEIYKQVKI